VWTTSDRDDVVGLVVGGTSGPESHLCADCAGGIVSGMPYFESSRRRRETIPERRPEVALEWELMKLAFRCKGRPVDYTARKLRASLKKFDVVATEEDLAAMAREVSEGRVPPLDFAP
jgi:hypothetical protein